MHAAQQRIARVIGASVAIVATQLLVLAAVMRIANVRRAGVAIVALGVRRAAVGGDAIRESGGGGRSAIVGRPAGIQTAEERVLGFVGALVPAVGSLRGRGCAAQRDA
jgi:hypothetical protein